jgi:hypothetical protein
MIKMTNCNNLDIDEILHDDFLNDKTCYGCYNRETLATTGTNSNRARSNMNEEVEDDEKVKQLETCPIYKKDGRSLNDIMEPIITEMKEKMKSSEMVGNYFPPKYSVRQDIKDFLTLPVYCFEPDKIILSCGKGMSSLRYTDSNCNGKISKLGTFNHRAVEGLHSLP